MDKVFEFFGRYGEVNYPANLSFALARRPVKGYAVVYEPVLDGRSVIRFDPFGAVFNETCVPHSFFSITV